jgi:hypothetical protein
VDEWLGRVDEWLGQVGAPHGQVEPHGALIRAHQQVGAWPGPAI